MSCWCSAAYLTCCSLVALGKTSPLPLPHEEENKFEAWKLWRFSLWTPVKSKGRGAKCLKSFTGTDRCSWRDSERRWRGGAGAVFDKSSGTRLKIKSSRFFALFNILSFHTFHRDTPPPKKEGTSPSASWDGPHLHRKRESLCNLLLTWLTTLHSPPSQDCNYTHSHHTAP